MTIVIILVVLLIVAVATIFNLFLKVEKLKIKNEELNLEKKQLSSDHQRKVKELEKTFDLYRSKVYPEKRVEKVHCNGVGCHTADEWGECHGYQVYDTFNQLCVVDVLEREHFIIIPEDGEMVYTLLKKWGIETPKKISLEKTSSLIEEVRC